MQLSRPSPVLSKYVMQYWEIQNSDIDKHVQRIIPNGLMEMTFYFSKIPQPIGKINSLPGRSFISGQLDNYYDLSVNKEIFVFSVTLKPIAAHILINIPVYNMTGYNVALSELKFPDIEIIEERLFYASTFFDRVKIIEEYLYKQITSKYNNHYASTIHDSVNMISKNIDVIKIRDIASFACLGEKQFNRVFKNIIGLSPKKFLRIVRFQNAVYQKQLNKNKLLTEVAYDAGYFDQSHMNNDFKSLSGKTPKEFFNSGIIYSDYYS